MDEPLRLATRRKPGSMYSARERRNRVGQNRVGRFDRFLNFFTRRLSRTVPVAHDHDVNEEITRSSSSSKKSRHSSKSNEPRSASPLDHEEITLFDGSKARRSAENYKPTRGIGKHSKIAPMGGSRRKTMKKGKKRR
jgi:hypothetical protein